MACRDQIVHVSASAYGSSEADGQGAADHCHLQVKAAERMHLPLAAARIWERYGSPPCIPVQVEYMDEAGYALRQQVAWYLITVKTACTAPCWLHQADGFEQ